MFGFETSMRKSNSLKAIVFIFVISFVMTSLIVNGQAANWGWSKVASPTVTDFLCVDLISLTDGWAVGSDGCIVHWDGTSWNNVTSPILYNLKSVDMVSSTDGWAVGQRGVIIR